MDKRLFITVLLFLFILNSTFAQRYYLVVLSTASKNDAIGETDKLKAGGFVNAGFLYATELKRYRVYLNAYSTREEAQRHEAKYKTKFHDSWIYYGAEPQQITTTEPRPVNSKEIEGLKNDFDKTKQSIREILDEVSELKIALQSETGNLHESSMERNMNMLELEERIKKLTEYIDQLEAEQEKRLKSLSKTMEEIESDYVKKTDTVSVSWDVVEMQKEKQQTVLSFSFGLNQTNVLSRIDTLLLDYLDVDKRNYSNTFWGLYFGMGYQLAKNWSLGIDFQSYFFNSYYYLQPSFYLKPNIRSASLPISFNPSLAVGTLFILPKTGTAKGGRYVLFRPGVELEWALSPTVSLFGGALYHSNRYIDNKQFLKSNTQHLIVNFGLRLNVTKTVVEPAEPIEP
ncbi:MAG: SPOR domain-containing protein [Prolixibacteraceae bacterium]|nr:SPOR domain-containing protein [Prolixibacteraceae bacterium]